MAKSSWFKGRKRTSGVVVEGASSPRKKQRLSDNAGAGDNGKVQLVQEVDTGGHPYGGILGVGDGQEVRLVQQKADVHGAADSQEARLLKEGVRKGKRRCQER